MGTQIREGEKIFVGRVEAGGGGGGGGRKGGGNYIALHCHHQNEFAFRWAAV